MASNQEVMDEVMEKINQTQEEMKGLNPDNPIYVASSQEQSTRHKARGLWSF